MAVNHTTRLFVTQVQELCANLAASKMTGKMLSTQACVVYHSKHNSSHDRRYHDITAVLSSDAHCLLLNPLCLTAFSQQAVGVAIGQCLLCTHMFCSSLKHSDCGPCCTLPSALVTTRLNSTDSGLVVTSNTSCRTMIPVTADVLQNARQTGGRLEQHHQPSDDTVDCF